MIHNMIHNHQNFYHNSAIVLVGIDVVGQQGVFLKSVSFRDR